MRSRSRSTVLDFVDEVTARHGSLEAFFAQLRADFDDEPTVVLPVLRIPPSIPAAWPEACLPTDEIPRTVKTHSPAQDLAGELANKPRSGAAALWARLLRRG
ncbi:hypothetical protein [Nocardia australiensis]|uniref:hypothetical protein n=1 Tax=Nocardia australiensis TaxID=2887191 RepID=UPI001D1453AA|nr:hypothetical protein [Nocardia australiensis]